MFDKSVPYYHLEMLRGNLESLPVFDLPENYGWRFYRPGDEREWARIECSAGEFATMEEGVSVFHRQFSSEEELCRRMIFLTDGARPFATATAWFGEEGIPSEVGRLHWVGIEEAYQRRNLCRPLVSRTMQTMKVLGHPRAILTTQTYSWAAIRVYRDFGFLPNLSEEKNLMGWKIVSQKTNIDFLKDLS